MGIFILANLGVIFSSTMRFFGIASSKFLDLYQNKDAEDADFSRCHAK